MVAGDSAAVDTGADSAAADTAGWDTAGWDTAGLVAEEGLPMPPWVIPAALPRSTPWGCAAIDLPSGMGIISGRSFATGLRSSAPACLTDTTTTAMRGFGRPGA